MSIHEASTRYGKLRGVRKASCTVFRGIPYAAPPLGALRWKAPQPPLPWDGVREAFRFAPKSMQQEQEPDNFYQKEFYADEDFSPPMSEDCLYLNIWTPTDTSEEKLPVAFWIHGGAFLQGYASEPEFDGAAFCRHGVILVTVGYRLGALGFLAHPWLAAEGGGCCGNYGILDQIAALTWVRENIGAFGGDSDKITVFGQSAGCTSAQILISSELTRGMIAGAILHSESGYPQFIAGGWLPADAYPKGERFVELCGARNLDELRAVPAAELLGATRELFEKGDWWAFDPVIDGHVLTRSLQDTLEADAHHRVPVMIGSTRNDCGTEPEKLDALRGKCVGWSLHDEALGRAPDYVYHFTHAPLGDDAGAFHAAELWYVFGTLHRSWRPKAPEDWALSKQMTACWANFIKSGDPNGEGLPEWRPCRKDDEFVREFA